MSADPTPSPAAEFRPYRRFVSWVILTFVTLGTAYMLISVAVTIYRRRNAVPTGSPVAAGSLDELVSCHEELSDVTDGLAKHLENFHHLVAHYDADEAQRWSEDQAFWLGQWKAAGDRCRFDQHRPGKLAKEWEQLGTVHAELRETEASFTKELMRFGRDQAPRLDRIRDSLAAVGKHLGLEKSPEPGDPTP